MMQTPDEVTAIIRLHGLGWGTRRIASHVGCSRTTVQRYVSSGEWRPYRRRGGGGKLAAHMAWVTERFQRHRGNADVVRQDLKRELGIAVTLRTLERAVAPLRQSLAAEALATVRFETPPGQQLQIDFGTTLVPIGGEPMRVYLFVATLGYSRRVFVQAFRHERQSVWFSGLEAAFRHFNGVPGIVLVDNPRALVDHHDLTTREVRFNARFHEFARHWGFRPRACAPYRARTKGKVERGVGYVKHNGIAGHGFANWAALEAHLAHWMREVADQRVHGGTGETPHARFEREEATALQPLKGRPPFHQTRQLTRQVQPDCAVEVDANSYSVPWRLIGKTVQVTVSDGLVLVSHDGREVARHAELSGRRQRSLDLAHFPGVAGMARPPVPAEPPAPTAAELLRPLAEYEQLLGGGW
jgi:transposase